jgi:hypothetical protein
VPFTGPFVPTTDSFSYTRRDPALSGLTYTVWTSPDLQPGSWTEDTGAVQARETLVNGVETMNVTLSAPLVDGRLFVRVQAAGP